MSILEAYVVPHPPILLPGVGRGEERGAQATLDAYQTVARRIAALAPELIILTTSHGQLYRDAISITSLPANGGTTANTAKKVNTVDGCGNAGTSRPDDPDDCGSGDPCRPDSPDDCGAGLWGDFADFRDPDDRLEFLLDEQFVTALGDAASRNGLPAVVLPEPDNKLDHGCMVPLYFIAQQLKTPYKIARIGISFLDVQSHYRMGQCLAQTVAALGRRAVLVASGDLSHRLKHSGSYGFNPAGPKFDQQLTAAFASGQLEELLRFDDRFRDDAAECGLNSFVIMAGALSALCGEDFESELLSYEGPWGVGYAVARFTPGDRQPSLPVRLAFAALRDWHDGNELPDEHTPAVAALLEALNREDQDALDALRGRQAGAFVSFHKGDDLRGCIGTIAATQDNLVQEICHNTVSAAGHDPRFSAIRPDETTALSCSVDVLGDAEPVASTGELDARRYGVIVSKGFRRGLLLPDLEGVDTPDEQISIALRKAGISADERYQLERFEVLRFK